MTYEDFRLQWLDEAGDVEVMTSGSTGAPKRITLSRGFMTESALRTNDFFNINEDSILHSCISPDTIGGKMVMVRAITAGCGFRCEQPSNRPVISHADDERVTLVSVVASQMLHIVEHPQHYRHVDTFLLGGSPVDSRLRNMIAASGFKVYESYGMTETASHIALRKIKSDEPEAFQPLAGIKVELDERGCLVILYPDGKRIVTNDMATLTPDGGFHITGRFDSMIITGGKKVNPLEVERLLADYLDIPFLITSRPDIKWGARVVAVVRAPESDASTVEAALEKAAATLPHYLLPKEVVYVSELPELPSGKPDRRPLKG